jgi:hypothetical protein
MGLLKSFPNTCVAEKEFIKNALMNNMIPDYKKSRMILNLFLDR